MPKLQSIAVSGYKSIRELPDFEMRNLNVLIGANGAGKSNFLGLFRFLGAIDKFDLQKFVAKEAGANALVHFGSKRTERLTFELKFDDDKVYAAALISDKADRLIFEQERIHRTPSSRYESTLSGSFHEESRIFSLLAGLNWNPRQYHFHDTSDTAYIKKTQASNDNLVLKADGANLAPYLRMLHQEHPLSYRSIVDTIRMVAPYFHDFVHRPGDPRHIKLEWLQVGNTETPFEAHVLSDGTLRFMCLTTLLLQPVALLPDVILIDEPELGLHPYAIAILVSMLQEVSESRQVLISTHSVELVNALEPEDIVVVEAQDGASTFKRFSQAELSGWLEDYSLGELWLKNVLGGRP
jgi:predicted ATPase